MAEALPEYPDSDFSEEELSPLEISFNKASDHVRKITSKLDNIQLLELYGLYKQGTEGKCNVPKPGWLEGRGRRKWEAWRSLGDLSPDAAKEQYIALVEKFDSKFTHKPDEESDSKEAWAAVSSLRYSPEPELVPDELTLIAAARENCANRIAELLRLNPELRDDRDEDGLTALHWAADRNATDALTAAIEGGCPIDGVDGSGQTALHYAASCGHVESTRILVEAGASLLKDEENCTPLDLAEDAEIKKILEGARK